MMTILNERKVDQEEKIATVSYLQEDAETPTVSYLREEDETEAVSFHEESETAASSFPIESNQQVNEMEEQSLATAIVHPHPTTQLLLSGKLKTHLPEVGVNSLVDAAAPLFSIMGKLKHIKWYYQLDELHTELVEEIKSFQQVVQSYAHNAAYITEYVPIACYALCVTLDDIILDTSWGGQGKWEKYSLVTAFTPEPPSPTSFFIILERLIRDPDIYIDVMEFMYLCLNFGFKCRNSSNSFEFNHEQLEMIMNSLYKRIRAHRGNISKVLSPFPIKQHRKPLAKKNFTLKNVPTWLKLTLLGGLSVALLAIKFHFLHLHR